MTTAHGGVAVDEGIISLPPSGWRFLSTRTARRRRKPPQVAHVFRVLRKTVADRYSRRRTWRAVGDASTYNRHQVFVATRFGVPRRRETGSVGRFGCFHFSDGMSGSRQPVMDRVRVGSARRHADPVASSASECRASDPSHLGYGSRRRTLRQFPPFRRYGEHIVVDVLPVEVDPAHLFFGFATCSVPGVKTSVARSPGALHAGPVAPA